MRETQHELFQGSLDVAIVANDGIEEIRILFEKVELFLCRVEPALDLLGGLGASRSQPLSECVAAARRRNEHAITFVAHAFDLLRGRVMDLEHADLVPREHVADGPVRCRVRSVGEFSDFQEFAIALSGHELFFAHKVIMYAVDLAIAWRSCCVGDKAAHRVWKSSLEELEER